MRAPQEHSSSRPTVALISLWVVVGSLSIYGAAVLRDTVDKDDTLRQQGGLRSVLGAMTHLGDSVGLGPLRTALGNVRAAINAPYTLFAAANHADRDTEHADSPPDGPSVAPPGTDTRASRAAPLKPARQPGRVLVVGASSIQFAVGIEFERTLGRYGGIAVKRHGLLATGLTRPDFMSWPQKLATLARSFPPDLVIINFGGNDAQPIIGDDGKKHPFWTEAWDRVYTARIHEIIDIARRHGADTVWLGMPVMRSPSFSKKMRRLNQVMRRAVQARGEVFIPTYDMASTRSGTYRKAIRFRKRRGLMRTSDGVHYTRLGARYLVEQVLQHIERRFILEPPETNLAVCRPHTLESELLGRTIPVVLYVPRKTSGAQAPVTVLLPEHGAAWTHWPDHPHRNLQRLAERHGIIIAIPEVGADGWYLNGAPPETRFLTHLERELLPGLTALPFAGGPLGLAGVKSGGHGALLVAARGGAAVRAVSFADVPLLASTLERSATVLARLKGRAPTSTREASPVELLRTKPRIPALTFTMLQPGFQRYERDAAALASTLTPSGRLATRPVDGRRFQNLLEALVVSQTEALALQPSTSSPGDNGRHGVNQPNRRP